MATQTTPGWADEPVPVTLHPIDAAVSGVQKETNFGSDLVLRLWVPDATKDGPRVRLYNGALDEPAVTWSNRATPLLARRSTPER